MEPDLTQRLHPDSIKASRISAIILNGLLLLLSAAYLVAASRWDWILLPGRIALGLFALTFIVFVWIVPTVEFRRFAYEVFEEELEIRSGLLFISNVLVPMVRVQHVEIESGPLMRKYGLAEVKVVTAATTHRISGLKQDDAERLKRRIGVLAKVVDDDE
ncbi:PH domain-containing protein [Paenibacillus sp. GYB004]|uniref:PH domain-containing protein n=1 Tax=Paenibacillus sp. GYB004 TaxID=2994393 RepID=UPI002F969B42